MTSELTEVGGTREGTAECSPGRGNRLFTGSEDGGTWPAEKNTMAYLTASEAVEAMLLSGPFIFGSN